MTNQTFAKCLVVLGMALGLGISALIFTNSMNGKVEARQPDFHPDATYQVECYYTHYTSLIKQISAKEVNVTNRSPIIYLTDMNGRERIITMPCDIIKVK